MAAITRKRARDVDYKQLNSLSSVVLFNTAPRQKRARFFDVERVISRRKVHYDYEYLVKWKGWSLDASTWEPSSNLTQDLLRNYHKPHVSNEHLEEACRQFCCGITNALRTPRTYPVYVNIHLDVWRHVTGGKGTPSQHRGNYLLEKSDMAGFKYLPNDWWYCLNQDGDGVAVDFPLKAKAVLSWSPQKYSVSNGKLVKVARFPIEKICLTIIRRPANSLAIL